MPFPAGINQAIIQNGYEEKPLDNLIRSPMELGVPKVRRRFTGRQKTIRGSLIVETPSDYSALMSFYYGEAAEGAAYFTFNDQHGGTMQVRFTSFTVRALGGVSWLFEFAMEEQPHA